MVERFHKAAQDGYLDVLREATRKDCNSKDEDGMTPTLWAAFEGNLDALRLLVGRGGDPEKCDNYGNTALHLSSAKGHLNCVTFLVNFGVNIWDLDIDLHTSKDLAAINSKEEILKFLDSAASLQEANNAKLVKTQQEKSKKEAEKRIKAFQKLQLKADKMSSKEDEKMEKERRRMSLFPTQDIERQQERRSSLGGALLSGLGTVGRRDSKVMAPPPGTVRYSEMVGGTVNSKKLKSGVFKKIGQKPNSEFTVKDTQSDGKRTVRSLAGLRRDSEIIFMNKENDDIDRLELEGESKPNKYLSEPSSIFNRPGFGSVAFRNSITAFNAMHIKDEDDRKEDSIGSAGSLAHRTDRMAEVWEE
ncbi:Usher syndrome type-1G protein homolog isoform X2 [Eurytemora carolleeae]|nr:Usher syndrome type-1G protein homolog isoform X2 [Eurytemora carolleeae]|eukprot:XP_023330781.1 Usher syndrome type-1G protein homolog isoform X2 [Eurytemora affinis]